jgi:CDP-6-deoxy-D-xylo-4-hexulose-3-dehydrase
MAARRRNFAWLKEGLSALEEFLVLPEATPGSDPCWFGFPLTVRETAPFTRDALALALNRARIGTRLLFGGNLVRQPYMLGRAFRVVGDLASSDRVMHRTMWIGVYPGLDRAAIDYVVEQIGRFCRGH